MAVLDRFRNKPSGDVEPRVSPMDDTPEPVEAALVPLSPRTAATIDQVPSQAGPLARARTLPSIFYNAQMDFPAHIQKSVMDVQAAFESDDWMYFLGGDAWFRLNLKLDMIMAWVSSQIDAKGILRGQAATVFDEYRELEYTVEDSLDLPFKKVEKIGAAMQIVGMALKESEKSFEALPANRMADVFRFADPDWKPSGAELAKYGIAQIVGYWKENMIDVGLDVFCVIETPKRIYPYGAGKSTLALQVGGAMATAMDADFDIRRDVCYQMDLPRLQRFFDDHRANVVRQIDESKFFWYTRTTMAGQQKRDMMALSVTRKDGQVWLAAASNVFRLDIDIYEEKATHILRIIDPGKTTIKRGFGQAILFEKADQDKDEDKWGRRVLSLRWVDFPAGSGPKTVYADCIKYTNQHARTILDDGVSPLDNLLDDDPTWKLDKLQDWTPKKPDGGLAGLLQVPVDPSRDGPPSSSGRPKTSEDSGESKEN